MPTINPTGVDADVATLCAETKGPPCPAGLSGKMTFFSNAVTDTLRPETKENSRATTYSIFDQDLKDTGKPPAYALNRFNFDEAHKFLIPRAVAYSAGLINHFFRGRLEIKETRFSGDAIEISINNVSGAGNPLKNGTFTLHYDAADGTRKNLPISRGASVGTITQGEVHSITAFVPPDLDITKDAPFVLVFNGDIGSEEGVAGVVFGAVPGGGFIFTPSQTPGDGISGNRLLTKQDGIWMLSPENNFAAGAIDWKGWYIGQTPTRVLTWNGPNTRYFPGTFSTSIYQEGKLFSVAPAPVLGAALTKDASGKWWLVAICQSPTSDLVYRRPATLNTSPAMYDSINAPEGWQLIADLPNLAGLLPSDRAWFFNGDGTEAQTMRTKADGGLTRLKIIIDGTIAGITDMGNSVITSTNTVSSDWHCGHGATINDQWENTITGDAVVAVDYLGKQEILARVTGTGYSISSYDDANTQSWPSLDFSISHTYNNNGLTVLRFGSVELVLNAIASTYNESGTAIGGYITSMLDGASSSETAQILLLDIRNNMLVYKHIVYQSDTTRNATNVPWFGSGTGTTKNQLDSEYLANYQQNAFVFYSDELSSSTTSGYSPTNAFSSIANCYGEPGNSYSYSNTTTSVVPVVLSLSNLSGSAAVDREQNAFISLAYRDKDLLTRSFNYLTDGDPASITGIGAPYSTFFPISPW